MAMRSSSPGTPTRRLFSPVSPRNQSPFPSPGAESYDGSVVVENSPPRISLEPMLVRAGGAHSPIRGASAIAEDATDPSSRSLAGGVDDEDEDEHQDTSYTLASLATNSRKRTRAFLKERLKERTRKQKRQKRMFDPDNPRANRFPPPPPPPNCFMCGWGHVEFDTHPDLGCSPYVKMVNILERALHEDEDLYAACLIVANIYHYTLYICYMDDEGVPILPHMDPDDFYVHITEHVENDLLMLKRAKRITVDTMDWMSGQLWNHKESCPDTKRVESMIKMGSLLARYMTIGKNTLSMAGGSGQIRLDAEKMGFIASRRRIAPYMEEGANQIGGTAASENGDREPDAQRSFVRTPNEVQLIEEDDEGDNDAMDIDQNVIM